MADFDTAWSRARDVPGWLTREQAEVLHREAAAVAPARVVEVGSHLGRSTVVLASSGAAVTAIDPFSAGWRYGAPDTESSFRANLSAADVVTQVDVRVACSEDELARWTDRIGLVYVDGKHDYWSCRRDLGWSAHVPSGGRVLVHDGFSSLGVTAALLVTLLGPRPRLRMVDRTGSLVRLQRAEPGPGDRRRVVSQLPWFVRNLAVKALLRSRLRVVARLLGHDGDADPY